MIPGRTVRPVAKYRNVDSDEVVDAVQVHHDSLPDGMELRTVTHPDIDGEVTRAFIATKDPDGWESQSDNWVDVAEGNWVITYGDGTVAVVADHNSIGDPVFSAQWEPVS